MAPLRYAAKFDPFLSLDCVGLNLILGVPLSCPHAQPLLPISHQPRESKSKSTSQPNPGSPEIGLYYVREKDLGDLKVNLRNFFFVAYEFFNRSNDSNIICINKVKTCEQLPCKNGGTCRPGGRPLSDDLYTCDCTTGFKVRRVPI